MHKLFAILHTKLYNLVDFNMWLKWYINYIKCDEIIIINDKSVVDINNFLKIYKQINNNIKTNIKIVKAEECSNSILNRQTNNYNYVIKNIMKPNYNDIIIIPDDDEFWWYDTSKFKNFKDCVIYEKNRLKTNCILVANILLCNNNYLEKREPFQNFNDISKFRCNLKMCENKPIIFYNNELLKFYHTGLSEHKFISNSSYWDNHYGSEVLYNHYLRLYHYRLTTNEEYKNKICFDANTEEIKNNKRKYMPNDISLFMQTVYKNCKNLDYNIFDDTIDKEYKKL